MATTKQPGVARPRAAALLLGLAAAVTAAGVIAAVVRAGDEPDRAGTTASTSTTVHPGCESVRRSVALHEALQDRLNGADDVFWANPNALRATPLSEAELTTYRRELEAIRAEVLAPLLDAYDEWAAAGPAADPADVVMQRDFAESRWTVAFEMDSGDDVMPSLSRLDPSPGLTAGALMRLSPSVEAACGIDL